MTQSTSPPAAKLQPVARLVLASVGIVGLVLLITARRLDPDPRGYGTHEQLGLTPCFFQQLTGHICPACGTTTAWAHALRGDLKQAASSNLGGTLLCGAALVVAPWLVAVAIAGRWLVTRPTLPLLLLLGTAWLVVALLDWLQRWLLS